MTCKEKPLLDSPLFIKPLSYFVEVGFHHRSHLEVFSQFITNIITAVSAVDNAFFLSAFPDGADIALTYVLAIGRKATHAVNVLRLEVVIILLSPFFSDYFSLFIIICLRGDISIAVGADQAAVGYLFRHLYLTPCVPLSVHGEGEVSGKRG
jgi:hypothetical protein